ncbi:Gfo/Idh/MocA family oxidoreductase [Arthrobacter sp. 4R501]|uniref:Gfo/Idh/MocA family oxidoreductase n=1 Tax=Arthrobacter sp. 4R501 TaxID=2058886 RepID=UPI0015E42535|nr:Gfo/Idh/MocA family oxidoreductase [Arthrobacter sp. 4R501]
MLKLGIIGLESSRPCKFFNFLVSRLHKAHITAVVAREAGADVQAWIEGGVVVVDRPTDLLGYVTAVIECSRKGSQHRANVEGLLRQGIHVWVDKPLATSVEDARALVVAAEDSGAFLMSYSGYRLAPQLPELAASLAQEPKSRRLVVTGPADANSEYDGLFHYGIHHVEIALELLGRPALEPGNLAVAVSRFSGGLQADFSIGGVDVALVFVAPTPGLEVPFSVSLGAGSGERVLTVPTDYNEQMLLQFLAGCKSAPSRRTAFDMVSPVAVLEDIVGRS